jgi:hypothetical protein
MQSIYDRDEDVSHPRGDDPSEKVLRRLCSHSLDLWVIELVRLPIQSIYDSDEDVSHPRGDDPSE